MKKAKKTTKGYYFFLEKKDYQKYKHSSFIRFLIRMRLLKRYHCKGESNRVFRNYFLIRPNYYYLGYVTNPVVYHLLSIHFRSLEVMYLEASDSKAFETILSSIGINGGMI